MKMHLLMFVAVTASLQAGPFKEALIDRTKLETVILEAAGKVEEKYSGQNADARDLKERVQGILQMPALDEEESKGAAMLSQKMSLLTFHFGIQPGMGGHSGLQADRGKQAQAANYHRLENLKAEGEEEVLRWMQMAESAGSMKDEEKERRCQDKAVGTARALVTREPNNAQAHALLADALGWRKGLEAETLQSMQKALKLDSRNLLARFIQYSRQINQVAEETFSRKPARLEDPLGNDFSHLEQSRANPLSEEETAALAKRCEGLLQESEALVKDADSAGDFITFCRLWECQTDLLRLVTIGKLPKQMPAETPLENMQGAFLQAGVMKSMAQVLCQPAEAALALKLAGDDTHRAGAVAVCCAMGLFFKAGLTQQPPGEGDMKAIQGALARLEELSRQSEDVHASHAFEAIGMIDCLIGLITQKAPQRLDTLTEALRLDPEGYLTLTLLIGVTSDQDLRQAMYALCEIQNAILPSQDNRKTLAAAASLMQDWDTAFRHLDMLRKEAPDDLGLLNQRIVTMLRQNQSNATFETVTALYGGDVNEERTKSLGPEERVTFIRNYILFLAMKRNKDKALELVSQMRELKILQDKDVEELRSLIDP